MSSNEPPEPDLALDNLADAITALATARNTIGTHHLMFDTAINIVVLTRIATQRITDHQRRDTIDELAAKLATELRRFGQENPS